jgi:hypothetical protein
MAVSTGLAVLVLCMVRLVYFRTWRIPPLALHESFLDGLAEPLYDG